MSDQPQKMTHAQKRRSESQAGARLKLRAGQFVRRLKEIADKAEGVDPSTVPALRLKADIYLKLLAKCLPDLRAIDHTGTVNLVNYDAAVLGLLNERRPEAGDAASPPVTVN